jgi:hypothetical protein
MSFTVPASVPEPYVHFDNRGFVLACGGRCTVFFGAPTLSWAADTLDVLAEEGRATRHQFERVFGGFRSGDGVVLFGGERGTLTTVQLSGSAFERLRSELRDAVPHRPSRG